MRPPGQTPLVAEVMTRLTGAYGAAADPVRAVGMAAYMRGQFAFLGIASPAQKSLTRAVLAGLPRPTEADLRAVSTQCWALPEREYQYFACGLLRRYAKTCTAGFLGTARQLIVTKSWWDTVDALAAHLVGSLVARHESLVTTMDEWIDDENLWLVRTAILHQLTYKDTTDAERLFRYCLRQAGHRDFFIRKAIGWALRQYAYADPDAVRVFVRRNESRLSPLSLREALKNQR